MSPCNMRKKRLYLLYLVIAAFLFGWISQTNMLASKSAELHRDATDYKRDTSRRLSIQRDGVRSVATKNARGVHPFHTKNERHVRPFATNSERHFLRSAATTTKRHEVPQYLQNNRLDSFRLLTTKNEGGAFRLSFTYNARDNVLQFHRDSLATNNERAGVRPLARNNKRAGVRPVATDNERDGVRPLSTNNERDGVRLLATNNVRAGVRPLATNNERARVRPLATNNKRDGVRLLATNNERDGVRPLVTNNERDTAGVLIVGAGLSGAVLAHLHATILKQKVLVIEKRDHVGGNCYDFINEHGIRVSKYGAHLFHTNNKLVWRYLSQFSHWIPYEHRVVGRVDDTFVPIPVNIDTVNTLFNQSIKNQVEMSRWLKKHQIPNDHPKNGEEAAKARVGEILFDKLFKHYTYKQWEKFPKDLDASVLQRIPVRDNFDDRYFPNDVYQALPGDGYTALVTRMLNHSLITVKLDSDFFQLQTSKNISLKNFSKTFFTGPIDAYFASSGLEKLEYRSIKFETIHLDRPMYQPNVVVNYPQGPEEFTRIVEYKHLYNQVANGTTIVREYSSGTGDPYYPVPNERNRKLYAKYAELAKEEQKKNSVYFVGRLASYKYVNMDQAVLNAINEFTTVYANVKLPEEKLFTKSLSEAEEIFKRKEGKSSIAVITSHCKENLTWISECFVDLCNTNQINIFIYEKCHSHKQGSEIALKYPECNILQLDLPNVGREGNTWLYHMLMKQTAFSDINVFLQGGMEVDPQRVYLTIQRMKSLKKFKHRDSMLSEARDLQDHYAPFGHFHCFDLKDRFLGWMLYQVQQKVCEYYHGITRTRDGCLKFTCTNRGEFVVTDVLLRRKLAIYRKLMFTWYADLSAANDAVEGHLLERLWTLFFRFPVNPLC